MTNLITADVGSFGKVKGFTIGNVAEFRGVPFATIPARFRRAEKVTSLSEGTFDATKYGPYPAQPPEDEAGEVFLFGPYCENFHAEERKRKMSEDDCLNVNIVTPKDAVGTKKLPVVAWIYGGAFCIGGNSKGIYNGTALVEESLKLNEPVVYVGINYRLNFFGFLASKELAKDNAKHGGGAGNYGIHDQRLALEWIQENISHFGGDPANVTIFGESAGSASVHSHILAGKPLFSRAILQSGLLADCLGPMNIEGVRSQGDFDMLVKKFGLEDKDDQGKVDGLRAVPLEELVKTISDLGPFPVFYPVDDSHLQGGFFEDTDREKSHRWLYHPNASKFVKGVIAGDCEVEGIIFVRSFMGLGHEQVLQAVQSSLPDSLLQHYGLAKAQTKEVSSIGQLIPLLTAFCTDQLFSSSIARFVREFSQTGAKVYSYHFDRGNTFPGPMNGIAHHALDLQYTFGTYRDGFQDKKDVELSNGLMKRWIDFANGKEPWADASSGKALRITPEAELEVIPRDQITSRRWAGYSEMEKNWDQVKRTGNMLITGNLEAGKV